MYLTDTQPRQNFALGRIMVGVRAPYELRHARLVQKWLDPRRHSPNRAPNNDRSWQNLKGQSPKSKWSYLYTTTRHEYEMTGTKA